jgi:hypothetical protein
VLQDNWREVIEKNAGLPELPPLYMKKGRSLSYKMPRMMNMTMKMNR